MWLQLAILGLSTVEPMPTRAPSPDPIDDVVQTIQARKLLHDEPRLRDFNIGVEVKNRIATLWGPAPSLEHSQLAESRLRGLIELRDVRNELHLSPEARPRPEAPSIPVRLRSPEPD